MRALPRGEVTVHLGQIFEDRHAGKRLHDIEHLLDLRLQMDKRGLTAPLFQVFASHRENTQAGAADEFQLLEVEYDVPNVSAQQWSEMTLQLWRSGSIQTPRELDGGSAGGVRTKVLKDLNFKWHMNGSLRF